MLDQKLPYHKTDIPYWTPNWETTKQGMLVKEVGLELNLQWILFDVP